MEIIFYAILILWYFIFLLFSVHLYISHYKKHEVSFKEQYLEKIPSNINLPNLSMLLYHKIDYSLFIATIYFLIYKKTLKFQTISGETYLVLTSEKIKLSRSQESVVLFLIRIIGDGKMVSIKSIKDYSNNSYDKSDFIFNYQMWLKESQKETSWKGYYEEIDCYQAASYISYLSVALALVNTFLKTYMILGYLPLILTGIQMFLFFKIARRTKDSEQEYFKWQAFKSHLADHNLKNTENTELYIIYGLLLRINVIDKVNVKNKREMSTLYDAIYECLSKTRLNKEKNVLFD